MIFNNANWGFAKLLLLILHFFSDVPGGFVYVDVPRPWRKPPCEVTVLDLGPGGAIHLRAGSANWLLDCGHSFEYQRIVLPYLRGRGINALDGFILTYGNADHIGGAVALLDDFRPPIVADSPLKDRSAARRSAQVTLAARGKGKRIIQRGDVLDLERGARLRVLYPPAGLQRAAADDKALVLRLEAQEARVLFMSASGFSTEEWLLQNEPDLRADLLVKGQHGSDLSGTPDFLARVKPAAIICASPGAGKEAQLDEWSDSVRRLGVTLFRLDQSGAVHVALDHGEIRADGFLNGQTFRNRAR